MAFTTMQMKKIIKEEIEQKAESDVVFDFLDIHLLELQNALVAAYKRGRIDAFAAFSPAPKKKAKK